MTGENFIRLNRHDTHLEQMLQGLSKLREQWSEEYHRQDEDGNYICDSIKLDKINEKIKRLKYNIYTYVYSRNTPNFDYIRDFEKKHLW